MIRVATEEPVQTEPVQTEQPVQWGRVDETGTVYVLDGPAERAVGQYPDATPAEALAYFQRKFTELAGQVTLLEQRIKKGAPGQDVARTVASLRRALTDAKAVGNLAALRTRVEASGGTVTELTQKQSEASRALVTAAIAEREALVNEAEVLAAQDPAKAQWKQVTAALDEMFARWQSQQSAGPRLPKTEANDLWKRFRAARTIIDTNRKAFFAEMDSTHKGARAAKQALVEKAEALIGKGQDGIAAYRTLLDQWKTTGRAGKKFDDALWALFKQAGDTLYAAKSEVDARDTAEFEANLVVKQALLAQAEPLLLQTNRVQARETLAGIQKQWDAIGKVPRESVKPIEDRLRKVESAVRKLDEEHWNTSNPERQQRSTGFLGQLNDAIIRLERELADAITSKDGKRVAAAQEALDARKAWQAAIRQ